MSDDNLNKTIKCSMCGQEKTIDHYKWKYRATKAGMCKECESLIKGVKYHGVPPTMKNRNCLKCGKEFVSFNEIRVCGDCKVNFKKKFYYSSSEF
jgi:hypothetical protein